MEDLAQKINEFLSTPGAMEQVQSVLSALNTPQTTAAPPAEAPSPPPQAESAAPPDLSRLQGLLGAMRQPANDPKVALLLALKPYLSGKRAEKIDTAIRLLQLSQYAPMLKQLL